MSIGSACQCEIVTTTKEASIQEVAKLMKENNVGNVVVVENQENASKPLGIITDRDIAMEIVAEQKNAEELRAGDVMSEDVLVLQENQGIKEALEIMREKGVRRAPIVSENDQTIGIATLDDLFVMIADEVADLAQIVRKQTSS